MSDARKLSDTRKINNVEISKECYKKIKILSIQREISTHEAVSELLEKLMSKKGNLLVEEA